MTVYISFSGKCPVDPNYYIRMVTYIEIKIKNKIYTVNVKKYFVYQLTPVILVYFNPLEANCMLIKKNK